MAADPSAVITQVPPSSSASQASGQSPPTSPQGVTPINAAQDANMGGGGGGNNGTQQKKKSSKKRSNFLCSICCLGRRGSDAKDGDFSSFQGQGQSGPGSDAVDHRSPARVKSLLPELKPEEAHKKCIVIDLDETLVHSSFKPINNADFIVPVEIDGTIHQVYVLKRPFVDEFLCRMGELFECVLFTASLAKYADPVADLLDKWDVFSSRLFRESCVFHRGNYVKDLSRCGRELPKILIVDNSPASYIFHPENAVPVASWFDDMNDRELLDLIPFLEEISKVDSVYGLLAAKFRTPGAANNLAANSAANSHSGSAAASAIVNANGDGSSIITSVVKPKS